VNSYNPFAHLKLRYSLLDYLSIIFGMVVVLAVFTIIANIKIDDIKSNVFFVFITYAAAIIAWCFALVRRLQRNGINTNLIVNAIQVKKMSWLKLFAVFFGDLTLVRGISSITAFIAEKIAPSASLGLSSSLSFLQSIKSIDSWALRILATLLLFITIVIVAPITEEFIFRGVLLHRLSAKWGATIGILSSSFLFGLIHANLSGIAIGISSIFSALIYIETRTLVAPIILHATNNFLAFAGALISIFCECSSSSVTILTLWYGIMNLTFGLIILSYLMKWPDPQDPLPYAANAGKVITGSVE
jgi:uncharacterized protein